MAVDDYIPGAARDRGIRSGIETDGCPGPDMVEGMGPGGDIAELFEVYALTDGDAAALPAILGADPSAAFLAEFAAVQRVMPQVRAAHQIQQAKRDERRRAMQGGRR